MPFMEVGKLEEEQVSGDQETSFKHTKSEMPSTDDKTAAGRRSWGF